MLFTPRPLPTPILQLCERLNGDSRLVAHLHLVHDVAVEIVAGFRVRFPTLEMEQESVLFGAASHDLGKVVHPEELSGPGHRHELAGEQLLMENDVSPDLSRFCRTHGAWDREPLPLEDLLVALADTIWKGQRREELEMQIVNQIVEKTELEPWLVFQNLDELLTVIASCGDERLAWQARF
jgi:HD domain.